MQSAVKLSISSDLKSETIKEQLVQTVNKHADQIGYMLQAYHLREKVSRAEVIPGSIDVKNPDVITLKIQYVLEEFSTCAAIDTLQLEKMTITILIDQKSGELELKGEYWPERDSD